MVTFDILGDLQKNQEFVKSTLDITKRLEEREAERAEYTQRKQAAERTTTPEMKAKLDKAARLTVDDTIGKLQTSMDDRSMENMARVVGDINDPNIYATEWDRIPPKFKKDLKLKGPKHWEEDFPKLKYFNAKTMHDIEQKRKLEQIVYESVNKATAPPYTKPDDPRYWDIKNQGAAIKSNMSQHPDFKKMTGNWRLMGLIGDDVFTSERIMSLSHNVVNEANQLMGDSFNNAVATRTHKVMGPDEAFQIAMDKQLAFLHNNNPAKKEMDFLSPEDAEVQRENWMNTTGAEMAANIPNFNSIPPENRRAALRKAYNQYQMHSYLIKRQRENTTRLFME